MSDSDSSIPQKVADLAKALEAVHRNIGSNDALNGTLHMWMSALGPDPAPWDGTPEEARERVLTEIAEFVEAVDRAERRLNAVPFSVFEPLSPFTDGVRWDVRTRRTLKEIQASISILRCYSTKPDFLLYLLRAQCTSASNSLQQKLSKYLDELSDRVLDLQCLPSQTYAIGSEWAAARVQLPPAGKGEDGETRNLNGNSLKQIEDQEEKDLLSKKVAARLYQTLWDYAQKMWAPGTDKFKICEHISKGPGNYSECLKHLVPNISSRTEKTKRFHSVCGALNNEIRAALGLEVYRFGQQIFVCEAGWKPLEHKPKLKPKKTTPKKSTTKRKR